MAVYNALRKTVEYRIKEEYAKYSGLKIGFV